MQIGWIEEHFIDWEGHVFGLGYGTGEHHIIPALKAFLAEIPHEGAYDHEVLEKRLGGAVTWFLITTLCKADILEYGSSPRFAWLTPQGQRLKSFIDARSAEELIGLLDAGTEPPNIIPLLLNAQKVHGIYVGSVDMFEAMNRAITVNQIRPVIDRVFPFAEARQAYEHLISQKHLGKIVIRVGDA